MAIDNSKLVLFPAAIQQPIIDPNNGLPAAGGWIEFTKTDQTTPKAVYQQTGDPDDPFEVANDLTPGNKGRLDLNNAGAPVSFPLFFYPFDEADNKTEELYYYRVNRADGSAILDANNMPQKYLNDQSGGSTSDESIENLWPSYGFEVKVWPTIYDQTTYDNFLTDKYDRVAAGWTWYKSTPDNAEFYYTFNTTAALGLDGNPVNELVLHAQNKTGDQTEQWIAAPVGYKDDLVGQDCELLVYNTDASSAPVTELDVVVIYAQNQDTADDDKYLAPIKVGEITLSTSRTKRTLQFTFPAIPTGTLYAFDRVLVGFRLPLNNNFDIGLTGTFFYNGQDKTITVPLGNLGKRIAIARNADPEAYNNGTNDWIYNNLPVIDSKGRSSVQNRTGLIISGALTHTNQLNFAHLCDGTGFVRGELIDGVTLSDRIMDAARPEIINSPNSFKVTNLTATGFDVELNQPGQMQDAWSTDITNLTITRTSVSKSAGITALVDGGNPAKLNITFDNDYIAAVTPYNFYAETNQTPLFDTLPSVEAVTSWFGTYGPFKPHPIKGNQWVWTDFEPLAGSKISVTTTVPGTSSTAAECNIVFGSISQSEIQANVVKQIIENAGGANRQIWDKVPFNYFAFMSKASSSGTMPYPPAYVISYKVNKQGSQISAGIHNIVVQLETADLSSPSDICSKTQLAVSQGDKEQLVWTGSALPPTGEWIKASSAHQDLIFIYWLSTDIKPTNPEPDRHAIYVQYESGDSLADVIKATSELFTSAVGGFPSQKTLEDAGYPVLIDGYVHYMEI